MAPVANSTVIRRALVALGLAGFAGTLILTYTLVGGDAFDYNGGFTLSALAAAAIIAAAVCVPAGLVARVLSTAPLVWLGTISYGAYLWHYPLFIFFDPGRTGLTGLGLFAVRFGATVAIAAVSYYLVERPVMEGTFWRSMKATVPALVAVAVTVAVLVAGTVVPATAAPAAHRFPTSTSTGSPREVVVLGDSTALTLGYALAATAPKGTTVVNGGIFGCGFAIASAVSFDPPSGQTLGSSPACKESTPKDQQWPAYDALKVAGTRAGDIVLYVAGEWDIQDLYQADHWTNITDPSFQRYELGRCATQPGSALPMAPMSSSPRCRHWVPGVGHPRFPTASHVRSVDHEGSRESPQTVSIVDYARILSPNGVFHEYLDGVQVRSADRFPPPHTFPETCSSTTLPRLSPMPFTTGFPRDCGH